MRITYLVEDPDGPDGLARSVLNQARGLVAAHEVEILGVRGTGPPQSVVDGVVVRRLTTTDETDRPATTEPGAWVTSPGVVDPALTPRLVATHSTLIPATWDRSYSALDDAVLTGALPHLHADVVVSTSPSLLAVAAQLLPRAVALVHQDHSSVPDRVGGLDALLTFLPRADGATALTRTSQRWLSAALDGAGPDIVVHPHTLSSGYLPASRLDLPRIVAAGSLMPEKQFVQLVQAFADAADGLPSWRLRILGSGPLHYEIVAMGRKLGLFDRLELPGRADDMASEWAKASIAAITSRNAAFPLVALEAMAAGVPVVAYDAPTGAREIIEHGVDGLLVVPGSVDVMAAALGALATDPDRRRRLGDAARRSVQRYSASALTPAWEDVLTRAVSARTRRGAVPVDDGGRPGWRPAGAGGFSAPRDPTPDDLPDGADPIDAVTPTIARTASMRAATDAARKSGGTWFVIPGHQGGAPRVVVSVGARGAFLLALAEAEHPSYLSLLDPGEKGWLPRRGDFATLAHELARDRTSVLRIEPWPRREGHLTWLAHDCGVDIELWEPAADDRLTAPRGNAWTTSARADAETVTAFVHGLEVPTLPVMTRPTVDECRFPVDVVYTWVDADDPAWQEAWARRQAEATGVQATRASSGIARFRQHDELRYSLRSVHLFAPWVRRIHLVTAGQVPDWLARDHPGIRLVEHRDILPAEALPTFNSHAIESALHRIPDLAEHFVYLNDDMFLGRPVRPEQFFTPGGLNAVYSSSHQLGLPGEADLPYLMAGHNNRRLLETALGVTITSNLAHCPYPHRVSVLRAIEAAFPDAVRSTALAPFRSASDVSLLSSLAQHYGLATGSALRGEVEHAFVDISGVDVRARLADLLERDVDCFCLGDHHDYALRLSRVEELLADFFEAYYPVPAPWERP